MKRRSIEAGLTLAVWLALAAPVSAHNVGAECRLDGDRVRVEAYFDDDTPAQGAKVRVLDEAGALMAEGRTDERGVWSFARPPAGAYAVHIDAGAGHRTKVRLTVPPGDEAPAETPLSEGPTRQEFTRMPWLKVGVGLLVIGGLAVAAWLANRGRPDRTGRAHGPAEPSR